MTPRALLFPLALALASTAFASGGGGGGGGDQLKAQAALSLPPAPPDADATGKVTVEIDLDKNRHRLKIEAEHLDTSLTFEAWLEDGGGVLQNVGVIPLNDQPNEIEIEFDSKEGPPLPFGTTDVSTLAGRDVEVRSSGVTYLVGTVPSIGGGGGGGTEDKAKVSLVRPAGAPDSNATGSVEIKSKGVGDESIEVEAEHLDSGLSLSVWMETAVGSGVLQSIGAMSALPFGHYKLEIESENGPLPLGAASVSDLSGRALEVRDGSNVVYLAGTVPAFDGSPGSGGDQGKGQTSLTPTLGGKAKLKVEAKKNGSQRFELEIEKLNNVVAVSSLEVFIEDPTSSVLTSAAVIAVHGGEAKLKIDTKKGKALPLGVATLETLVGQSIEIRVQGTATVLFTGTIPTLN